MTKVKRSGRNTRVKGAKNERHHGKAMWLWRMGEASRFPWALTLLSMALIFLLGLSWSAQAEAETFAYVTTMENTLKVIRTSDNTVVATVGVGSGPRDLAVNPDGAFVYVANLNSNDLSIIRTADRSLVAQISVGIGPVGVAITSDGAFVYVTNRGSHNVSVIRTADNMAVATIPVRYPVGVAITPDGAFAYVTNEEFSGNVSVIRISDNTEVATIPVGRFPVGAAITPNGAFVYVTNNGSSNVSVIRTADNTVVATIPVGIGPLGVGITPDGAFTYVANSDSHNVSVIRISDNTVDATVAVGLFPKRVAITPDGASVYVANKGSINVSVIRAADNTVVATIPVGSEPWGVAIGAVPPVPVPTLSLALTGCTTCQAGDQFTVQARVINTGSHDVLVEAKIGVRLPNGTTINMLGNKHPEFSLPAGLDRTFTIFDVPSLPAGLPTGTWTFEGTLLGPDLGETFSREVKPFEVVP